jgi:hypothetical protein
MRTNYIIIITAVILLFSSCEKEKNINSVFWGETNYYSNFLLKKYKPVIMEKTLEFDFNEDAKRLITGNIEFEIVVKDKNDKFVPTDAIVLYKNNIKCSDNILKITSKNESVQLGIEFIPDAKEGNYTLYLRVKETGGLDRIDDTDLSTANNVILAHEWVVKKDDVYNPLALSLFWILVTTILFLMLWYMISRLIINPNNRFSKISFDYHDGQGEKSVRVGNCYKVICTNKRTEVSLLHKFFVGNVAIEINDFWTKKIEIKSEGYLGLSISGIDIDFQLEPWKPQRKELFTITKPDGQTVQIETT